MEKDVNDEVGVALLVEEYLKFARATNQFGDGDYEMACLMCAALQTTLEEKALDLIRQNMDGTVVYSYQSDGTSNLCQHIETSQGSTHIMRKGRVLVEFLLERGLVLSIKASELSDSCVLIATPRLMLRGKDHLPMFSAHCDFFPTLRACGHRGVSLTHGCFDRLMYAPLARAMLLRREAQYGQQSPFDPAGAYTLWLLNWQCENGCVLHDLHNAMKWGL